MASLHMGGEAGKECVRDGLDGHLQRNRNAIVAPTGDKFEGLKGRGATY